MIIGGFQKFSLLEYPGKMGAVIFTQGCNFRCPYCHNPELVDPWRYCAQIPDETVLKFLEDRRGKLESVVITGGEPTVQSDLIDFAAKVKEMGFCIKLDTNGSNPLMLEKLIEEKLIDYWAMDLKAPLSLYSLICGCAINDNDILRSMDLIRNSGSDYEFRTTYFNQILSWNDILEIQLLLETGESYYLQQCIYENTLSCIQNPFESNSDLLFNKETASRVKENTFHYNLINNANRLKQIMIKMR